MLFVKLNPESVWKEYLTSMDLPIDEIDFIRSHANSFPTPASDLLLFCYIPKNYSETFVSKILHSLICNNLENFSLDSLVTYLSTNNIQKDLYTYYLGDKVHHSYDFDSIIRTHKYIPDKVKLLLFGFTLNPIKYITLLIETIKEYYKHILTTYIPSVKSVLIPPSFIDDIIKNTYSPEQEINIKLNSKTISYSLCFTIPDYLIRNFTKVAPYLITTKYAIDNTLSNTDIMYTGKLITNAAALSDKYRLSIIELLLSNQSMTLQEISHAIGLSGAATNHHITLLKQANMVSIIRHSRAIYYSYNPEGFKNTIKLLHQIEKGVKKI